MGVARSGGEAQIVRDEVDPTRAFVCLQNALHSEADAVGTCHLLGHKARRLGKHLLHLVPQLIAHALNNVGLCACTARARGCQEGRTRRRAGPTERL